MGMRDGLVISRSSYLSKASLVVASTHRSSNRRTTRTQARAGDAAPLVPPLDANLSCSSSKAPHGKRQGREDMGDGLAPAGAGAGSCTNTCSGGVSRYRVCVLSWKLVH